MEEDKRDYQKVEEKGSTGKKTPADNPNCYIL
jgi:hypothetical protein